MNNWITKKRKDCRLVTSLHTLTVMSLWRNTVVAFFSSQEIRPATFGS